MHRTIKLLIAVIGVIATVAGAAVAATTPSVSTGKATSIHDVSAVLNGTVNPNGTTSVYHFEWGLTTAYGVTSSRPVRRERDQAGRRQDDCRRSDPRHRLPLPALRAQQERRIVDRQRSDVQDVRKPTPGGWDWGDLGGRRQLRDRHRGCQPEQPGDAVVLRVRPDDPVHGVHPLRADDPDDEARAAGIRAAQRASGRGDLPLPARRRAQQLGSASLAPT